MQTIPASAPASQTTTAGDPTWPDYLSAAADSTADAARSNLDDVLLCGQHMIDTVIADFERSVAGRDDYNAITMGGLAAALRAVSTRIGHAEIH